ncbi:MAG: class I SAM-dependent methyltransferase [Anaerolineales bacterium]
MTDTYSHYSRTVEYYSRYRPRYPQALIPWLTAECGLAPGHVIADIGSGTGQMTELFLQHGHPVYAVEPNPDMRRVAENELAAYPQLTSLDATAEATAIPDHCVDLITVGNAFHWFDYARTREEFLRILKPGGWVVLAWNLERASSPFGRAFEAFWQKHIDPNEHFTPASERKLPAYIAQFFGEGGFKQHSLDNVQVCDFDALLGVTLSTLKAPQASEPRFAPMAEALQGIFEEFEEAGRVRLEYDTALVWGRVG